jgi:hypothetical protein
VLKGPACWAQRTHHDPPFNSCITTTLIPLLPARPPALPCPPAASAQAPAHALPFTEAAVQQAFGFTAADLFSEFAAAPVASGSIGQIHRGLLSDTGARLTGMQPGERVGLGLGQVLPRLLKGCCRGWGGLPCVFSCC